MPRWKYTLPLLLPLAFGAGCAKVQPYRPAPIAPAESAQRLEARRLTDPALERFLERNLGHPVTPWPVRRWDLRTLTLAALYFNPQMKIARDQVAVAKGAIVTAGEKPNPTLSITPGIPSPYLFDLPLVFPIETHGKRELRIEEARHLSSAARFALSEAAWQVASGVRKALLAWQVAERKLALDRATARIETRRAALLGRILAAGEGSRPALQTVRVALSNARFTIKEDEGQVATTRAALAGAIGVPVDALAGLQLAWPNFARLTTLATLSPRRIQREAVLNRLDVRRALEQYAAADAALRLQLARQYPNFNIGPAYFFEEGNNYFAVPFSIVLPIRNRNQGPIAQAEALRKETAANFLAVQALAIAQSQQALAAYRAALGELQQASRPLENQRLRVRMSQRAVAAGETSPLQLNALRLEGVVYAGQRLQALGRAQQAFGALEDAVEKPLGPDRSIFPPRARAAVARSRKESRP